MSIVDKNIIDNEEYNQGFFIRIDEGYCHGTAWNECHIMCPHCLNEFHIDFGFGYGEKFQCEVCNAILYYQKFKYFCDYRKIQCANGHQMEKHMNYCYECGVPLK